MLSTVIERFVRTGGGVRLTKNDHFSRFYQVMTMNLNTLKSRHSEVYKFIDPEYKRILESKVIKVQDPIKWKCNSFPPHTFVDTLQSQLAKYSQYGECIWSSIV